MCKPRVDLISLGKGKLSAHCADGRIKARGDKAPPWADRVVRQELCRSWSPFHAHEEPLAAESPRNLRDPLMGVPQRPLVPWALEGPPPAPGPAKPKWLGSNPAETLGK